MEYEEDYGDFTVAFDGEDRFSEWDEESETFDQETDEFLTNMEIPECEGGDQDGELEGGAQGEESHAESTQATVNDVSVTEPKRFASLSEADINQIVEDHKESASTKANTRWALKTFNGMYF